MSYLETIHYAIEEMDAIQQYLTEPFPANCHSFVLSVMLRELGFAWTFDATEAKLSFFSHALERLSSLSSWILPIHDLTVPYPDMIRILDQAMAEPYPLSYHVHENGNFLHSGLVAPSELQLPLPTQHWSQFMVIERESHTRFAARNEDYSAQVTYRSLEKATHHYRTRYCEPVVSFVQWNQDVHQYWARQFPVDSSYLPSTLQNAIQKARGSGVYSPRRARSHPTPGLR